MANQQQQLTNNPPSQASARKRKASSSTLTSSSSTTLPPSTSPNFSVSPATIDPSSTDTRNQQQGDTAPMLSHNETASSSHHLNKGSSHPPTVGLESPSSHPEIHEMDHVRVDHYKTKQLPPTSLNLHTVSAYYQGLPSSDRLELLQRLLYLSPATTQFAIQKMLSPALRFDILSHLPSELFFSILKYLDLRTLGRLSSVCKNWHQLLLTTDTDMTIWRRLYRMEGWQDAEEEEEADLAAHAARKLGSIGGNTLPSIPPMTYQSLYKKHHGVRTSWFKQSNRHISFPGHGFNVVTCLQFDNDRVVSGSDDHTIHIYDIKTGTMIRRLIGHEGGVWALQYFNNTLVSGSTDRSIRIWDMTSGDCRFTLTGHVSTIRCLLIMNPGPIQRDEEGLKTSRPYPVIVTGSRDATVRIWRCPALDETDLPNPSTDLLLHVLTGHTNSVRAVSGEADILISGSYDTTVRCWDIAKGVCKWIYKGHREKVYSVDYCHELNRAVSGSMDASIKVWCTETGVALFSLEGHQSLVGLLEISPKFIVSAAADATLRIWDSKTGFCHASLAGHPSAITCFHHDPTCNKIVSGSDGGIKTWELDSFGYGSGYIPPSHLFPRASAVASHSTASGPQSIKGRFLADYLTDAVGVWRVKMNERYIVAAVQRDEGRTWFEVLDFAQRTPYTLECPGDGGIPGFDEVEVHADEDADEDEEGGGDDDNGGEMRDDARMQA